MNWTVDKALSWATLAAVLLGLAVSAATCSRAFDKIENHEKRLAEIESSDKAGSKELQEKLQKIQSAVDFMNWRMDGVTKTLEKQEKKR